MNFNGLFSDKSIRAKDKTAALSSWLFENPHLAVELVSFASAAKDPVKASCIEAFEIATQADPRIASEELFGLVVESLGSGAPRVRWESARVIGNIGAVFADRIEEAVPGLLANTGHSGTVVRWSAALALCRILELHTRINPSLIPAVKNIAAGEEKNSIRKLYEKTLERLD